MEAIPVSPHSGYVLGYPRLRTEGRMSVHLLAEESLSCVRRTRAASAETSNAAATVLMSAAAEVELSVGETMRPADRRAASTTRWRAPTGMRRGPEA